MRTLTAPENVSTVAVPTVGIVRRIRARLAALFVGIGFLIVGTMSPATAAPADPLGGAGDDLTGALLDNFQTYVIPAVVGILVAVLAFKLIVKMASRFLNRA